MIWSTPSSRKAHVVARSAVDGGMLGEAAIVMSLVNGECGGRVLRNAVDQTLVQDNLV